MSVRDKLEDMDETRETFEDTRDEFHQYTRSFAAGVERKRDVSELEAAAADFRADIGQTQASFETYGRAFQADVDARRGEIGQVRDAFSAFGDEFAADVAAIRDVSALHAAISELRSEMNATGEAFGAYATEFAADVDAIRDVTALLNATEEQRAAFAAEAESFTAYADAFESDVAGREAGIDAVADAFDAYTAEFHSEDVQDLLDAISALCNDIETLQSEFDATEATFAAYVSTFYGAAETSTAEAPAGKQVSDDDATAPDGPIDIPVETNDPESAPASDDETGTSIANETDDNSSPPTRAATSTESDGDGSHSAGDDEVEPEDGVECLECGEYYQAITDSHLRTHDMTLDEYRDEYGDDVPLRPEDSQ